MPRTGRPSRPLAERFWEKVDKTASCWLWTGTVSGPNPSSRYGIITLPRTPGTKGKPSKAHRMAYELCVGPIPDGRIVCHRCDVPTCVNPAHLFLGTPKDNALDMVAKGRSASQKRTTCPHGHPLDGMDNRGSRYCKTCHRIREATRWRSLRAAGAEKGIPCACGCGGITNRQPNNQPAKWIEGHHPMAGKAQQAKRAKSLI